MYRETCRINSRNQIQHFGQYKQMQEIKTDGTNKNGSMVSLQNEYIFFALLFFTIKVITTEVL